MAVKLSDKAAISSISDNDTILVVKSTGEVRRITMADLAAIMNLLPQVSSADDGKILMVRNGQYAVVDAFQYDSATNTLNIVDE